MSVDAFVTKTGMKSVSKLHTSTYLGGKVDIQGTKMLKIQMKIPKEKFEVFEASADFFSFRSGEFQELGTYQKREEVELCSPPTSSLLLGLQTCGRVVFHHGRTQTDPSWFFAGPARAELVISKTDAYNDLIFKVGSNITGQT